MSKEQILEPAVLWDKADGGKVACGLCNWRCVIADGKVGHCGVRKNVGGALFSLNYHKVCAANADPIEKKPLFHFLPSTSSYSISAPGCNFRCTFCQNWQISQMALESGWIDGQNISPRQILEDAMLSGCKSIAYTYTEPTIFMELCADCGVLAKEAGLKNVFVSNGYMTHEAVDFAADWLDGINIDLKAFSEDYYKNLCKAKLAPVVDTIRYIAKNTDIWMELTTLIIPGDNDSDDELKAIADFIASNAGCDTPWHVSRFHPMYKMDSKGPTPAETLQRAYEIGKQAGLRYIYVGNLPGTDAESTICHSCGETVIKRCGYSVREINMQDGGCAKCKTKIAGVW
jgi:pyruvate formate lyase activating enzyme